MEKNILIISNSNDPHAEIIENLLRKKGAPYFRLNTEKILKEYKISFQINDSNNPLVIIKDKKTKITSSNIVTVWYRRPVDPEIDTRLSPFAKQFVLRETKDFLENLYFSLPTFWVNDFLQLRRAGRKFIQLIEARRVGFKIPRTVICHNIVEAKKFYRSCKNGVVAKTLNTAFVRTSAQETLSIFTNELLPEHLENAKAFSCAPLIIQEKIPKKLELRITIIGNKVYPVALETQQIEKAKLDWRRAIFEEIPHKYFPILETISNAALQLVRNMGLVFASMDVILTPEDEFVFLDLNPNGQWLWLEEEARINMSDHFVDMLICGKII